MIVEKIETTMPVPRNIIIFLLKASSDQEGLCPGQAARGGALRQEGGGRHQACGQAQTGEGEVPGQNQR